MRQRCDGRRRCLSFSLLRYSNTPLLHRGFYARYRNRGNAFTATDGTQSFVGRRFDPDLGLTDLECGSDFLAHRADVRPDLRRFRDDCRVDVDGAGFLFAEEPGDTLQNLNTADPTNRFVGIREMLSDVAGPDGTKKSIGDRMR